MRSLLSQLYVRLPRDKSPEYAAAIFPIAIGLLLLLIYVGLATHMTATAYIRAESMWSKAQKEAILAVERYDARDDPADLDAYRVANEIPRADRRARKILEGPHADYARAAAELVNGGSSVADAANMARLFGIFRTQSDVARALSVWARADVKLDTIDALVNRLVAAHASGDAVDAALSLSAIEVLDHSLSSDERAFSEALADGTRFLGRLLLFVSSALSVVLVIVGMRLNRRLVVQANATADAERALRERDERLRQSQKMEAIGRLAGGVAHDFNNILTSISAHAEMLLEELEPGTTARSDVDEIARSAIRAASLTKQLLAFSRQQVLAPRLLDFNAVVAEMEKMLRRLIGENITLKVERADALYPVLADRGQLEQVLLNLAVNARDAMPNGGMLAIRTSNLRIQSGDKMLEGAVEPAPGDYVSLTVADTGVGMDDATRRRAFEPFFTTKEQGKGTGLGLATVHGIVEQSGGFIDVESSPGHGARFNVLMPRAEQGQIESGACTAVAAAVVAVSGTVLLVEDDEQVRAVVRRILVAPGYTVIEAKNGREALELARASSLPIDVVVTDALMPEMSGPQLIMTLRDLGLSFAAVLMSGYTDDAVIRSGAFPTQAVFVQKPFTAQELLRAIAEAQAANKAAV